MNMLANTMTASLVPTPQQIGTSGQMAPRKTLTTALPLFGADTPAGWALDLGCGSGVDTLELLGRDWHVVAVDSAPEALATLLTQTPAHCMARLTTRLMAFEELPAARLAPFDLVNASFSLPYCPPQHFGVFWSEVRQLIRRNGRFCGHFFGLSDDTNQLPGMSLHSLAEVFALFAGFEVEMLSGVETDKPQPNGSVKHSHIISVIARKN